MVYSYTPSRWNQKNLLTVPISLMILASLWLATTAVHAQSPDFALTGTPTNLCVNPGVNAVTQIGVQSLNGFAGTINLGSTVDPTVSNGPTLSPIPSSETLTAGQSVTFNLAISTTTSTPLYTYSIRLAGLSGATFHEIVVQLTVAAGCSVGGVVLPTAGLAPTGSYLVFGLAIAGLVGLAGATLAIRVRRQKPIPSQ
jgi:hypothetical protein